MDDSIVDDSTEFMLDTLKNFDKRISMLGERIDKIETWQCGADKEINNILIGVVNSKEQMLYVSEKMKETIVNGRKRIAVPSTIKKISLPDLQKKD